MRLRAPPLAVALLTLVLGASLFFTVHPWYDPTNDGSMYIATARSLAAGEGYQFLGTPFRIRPPGFPLTIAPLLALRGTDFFALNLLVSVFGALGILAFHFFLRPRLGLWLATLVPLVLWFNPGYQRLSNQVMSDVPGWTLLVVGLLLARRLARKASVRGALALGVFIGLATLMRSGNLLLLPALVGAELLRQLTGPERPGWPGLLRHSAALGLGTLLVLGPWAIRDRAVAPPPPADQTLLYSYASGMWHTDMGDPRSPRVPAAELLARFPRQGAKLLHTLGTAMEEGESGPLGGVLAVVLLLALLATAVRRRAPEELFCLATLLVVAFYFGYAGRLLLPVFALALADAVEWLRDGLARLGRPQQATAGAALACVAWIALDWEPRAGWSEIEALHESHLALAEEVSASVAPGEQLGAYRGWHHAVYLVRPVYSFEQSCERAGTPAAAEAVIERYGIDAILLTPLGLPAPVARAAHEFAAHVVRLHGPPARSVVHLR